MGSFNRQLLQQRQGPTGINRIVHPVAGDYVLSPDDDVVIETSAGHILSLPFAPLVGDVHTVISQGGTNTLSGNGRLVNGSANLVLLANDSATCTFNGTNWQVSVANAGSGGGGGSGAVDIKTFPGVDPTGATGSASGFALAFATTAANGETLLISDGTYQLEKLTPLVDGLVVERAPDSVLVGTIAGATLSTSSMFFAPVPAFAGAPTTLAADVATDSRTLSITSNPGGLLVKGAYFQIVSVANNPLSAIYRVAAISGGGPFSVTADRPVQWPFKNGDTINVLSAKPVAVQWNGNGAPITGKAAAFFAGCFWDSVIENEIIENLDGSSNNIDAAGGFNFGSFNCVWRHVRLDATGGGTALNTGFSTDGEGVGFDTVIVENGAPGNAMAGIKYADARSCWDRNCQVSNAKYGVYVGSDVGATPGCQNIRSQGGNYSGNSFNGVWVTFGSSNIFFDELDANDNVSADGIVIDAGCLDVTFGIVNAHRNGLNGAKIVATAKGTEFDALYTNNNVSAGLVCDEEVWVGYHEAKSNGAGSTGVSCLEMGGTGRAVIERFEYLTIVGVFGVKVIAAGRADLLDGTTTLLSNAVGYAPAVSGAKLYLTGCIANIAGGATGTFGFYATAAGALLALGPNCDASATATPLTLAGGSFCNRKQTVTPTAAGVAVPYPSITSTDVVLFTPQTPGGTVPQPHYTITPGVGFTAFTSATDTTLYEYFIP
jgi:hypothetical protein